MPKSIQPVALFSRSKTSTDFFCLVFACWYLLVVSLSIGPFSVPLVSSTMPSCSMNACAASCNRKKQKKIKELPASETPRPSFYQRKLPDTCVAFASSEGKKIFKSALVHSGLKSFYNLIEQHHTQTEPAFCGVSTRKCSFQAWNGTDCRCRD